MKNKTLLSILLIVTAVVMLVMAFHRLEFGGYSLLQDVYGQDYRLYFDRALHAANPYDAEGFYNPFWLLPFVAVTELFGTYKTAVWVTVNLCAFLFMLWKMKMPGWLAVPFFVFSGALLGVFTGNAEGLVALGLVLPPPLGIVFLMMKPQIGMALSAYFLLEALIHAGGKKAALTFAPVAGLTILSFILFGAWFLKADQLVGVSYNTINIFPMGVPVGLALVLTGARQRNIGFALIAIPLTTPYMNYYSWAFPFLGVGMVMVSELRSAMKIFAGKASEAWAMKS